MLTSGLAYFISAALVVKIIHIVHLETKYEVELILKSVKTEIFNKLWLEISFSIAHYFFTYTGYKLGLQKSLKYHKIHKVSLTELVKSQFQSISFRNCLQFADLVFLNLYQQGAELQYKLNSSTTVLPIKPCLKLKYHQFN